jgi:multidrug efflux system outer membrane protein
MRNKRLRNKILRAIFTGATFLVIITLWNCTPVKRLYPSVETPEQFINSPKGFSVSTSNEKWWEEFKDETLNRLVEKAIRENYDIKVAIERVNQARALLGVKGAERFPTVNLNLSVSRQRQSTQTNTFNINLVASYEADLWGRLSSEEVRAETALMSLKETKRLIMHRVIADVVNLYINIKALRERLLIKREKIKNVEENLRLIETRYRLGVSSYLEVLQARATLEETRSEIEPLRRHLKDILYRLSVLIGEYPSEIETSSVPLSGYVQNLEPVPVGLPSELLMRRPDLRVESLKTEEAFQALKVTRTMRFPSIALTATGGWSSSELKGLFRPESLLWQLSLGVVQHLFNAGKLKQQEKAALSLYKQRLTNYAKVVLRAFYEVEKALADRKSLYTERQKLYSLMNSLDRTYRTALERYRQGLVGFETVLQAQRQFFNAKEALINTDEAILINRVFLYRALGGKWTTEEGDKQ